MEEVTNQLAPDWTKRRQVIQISLVFLAAMLTAVFVASIVLCLLAKLGFYITLILMIFLVLSFVAALGIIGSYIFGARWETKDFLDTIQHVLPDFYKRGTSEAQAHDATEPAEPNPQTGDH